ncbi:MAG: hypothetical protein H0U49_04995 [Parachlamydiaceae bacterium]|nr:hypothetical protein [Parachlamydiaceae bacterium]
MNLRTVDKFLAFSTNNLEVLKDLTNGDKLGYDIVDSEPQFFPMAVNRNSVMGLGWLAQNTCKYVDQYYYGSTTDVDLVQKEVVLYFDRLMSLINDLPSYIKEMEKLKKTGVWSFSQFQELMDVKEKLKYLQTTMKTASLGLMGLFQTALHGKTDDKNEGGIFVTLNWARGKEIKNKCTQALNYVHLSFKNEHDNKLITDMLQRVTSLLDQKLELVEESSNKLSTGYLRSLFGALQGIGSYCQSLFIDGNHLSKQHKWHLFMKLTVQNLEQAMGQTIEEMFYQLSLCNVNVDPDLMEFTALTEKVLCLLNDGAKEFAMDEDERTRYRAFVSTFRQAAESTGYQKLKNGTYENKSICTKPEQAFKILRTLNFVRFTENNINEFSEYMLCRLGVEKYSDNDIEIAKKVTEGFEKFDELKANRFAKNLEMSKAITTGFDSYAKSNSPHMLGTFEIYSPTLKKMKPVIVMRMACPTIDFRDNYGNKFAKLNPEYRLFLEECHAKSKKVLYISSQSQHPRTVEEESHRNKALINAMDDFPGTFHVVVLDNDYHLYLSKEPVPTKIFIDKHSERMMENQFYYFPESWKEDDDFKSLIKDTLKANLKMMFGDNPPTELTKEQQADLIEQCHALLCIILPGFMDADIESPICKDAIDRAMKMLALMLEILAIAQNHDKNIDVRWMIRVMIHSPAALIKAQSMNSHVKKLDSARTYLQDEEVKKRIRDPDTFKGIIKGCDGLPINYHGKFDFQKLENQRPSEVGLKKFATIIKEADANGDKILHNFFHTEYLNSLINKYINSDYFINSSDCERLQVALVENGMAQLLVRIATQRFKDPQNHQLPLEELQKLSGVVSELLFFAFLHPKALDLVKSHQFSDSMLSIQLKEILNNPLEFLSRMDALGSYYGENRSIPQKMLRHCFLRIKNEELRRKIRSDALFKIIDNSPSILEFMGVVTDVPKNELLSPVFGEVTCINHALDMLVMGESAVKLAMGDMYPKFDNLDDGVSHFNEMMLGKDKQLVHDSNILQTASLLKAMRQLMASVAENNDASQVELLHLLVPIWNHAMMNLKKAG